MTKNCWKIIINGCYTYGVSGSRSRSVASRRRGSPRCTAGRRCSTAPWPCRSSRSSTGCRTFRARRCRTASHSALYSLEGLWIHEECYSVGYKVLLSVQRENAGIIFISKKKPKIYWWMEDDNVMSFLLYWTLGLGVKMILSHKSGIFGQRA